MIWHYFPIGMRFPVRDFSNETRRKCWETALSAAFASDARGTGLYEACETYDPGSQSAVYTCIVCYVGIKQSRAAGKTYHSLDRLMARLCLNNPLVQANYLESFGPYPILAEIDDAGKVRPSETGALFLPTEPVEPMRPADDWTVLIASAGTESCDAETVSRVLGTSAADNGFHVRRAVLANGGEGTVRSLVSGTNGRYETVALESPGGDRTKAVIGVIPGPVAVLEAASVCGESKSSRAVGSLIRKTLDLGYRTIWIALGDTFVSDFGTCALSALGIQFLDTENNPVEPCSETLQTIDHIDRSGLDPRIGESRIVLLYNNADPVSEPETARLAALYGFDPGPSETGINDGLALALASIGGTLVPGADRIPECIGLSEAVRTADFVIAADRSFDESCIPKRSPSAVVLEQLSDSNRPGCLFVESLGEDSDMLIRDRSVLKGIVVNDSQNGSFEKSAANAFASSILPMIGKHVANTIRL